MLIVDFGQIFHIAKVFILNIKHVFSNSQKSTLSKLFFLFLKFLNSLTEVG